jgi:WD40 repeat protein
MLTVGQEDFPLIEIDVGSKLSVVAFAGNGEYIVGSDGGKVQVWRLEDGKLMATLATENVRCLAVSKDGRRIAAGSYSGGVAVWDANTFELQVCPHSESTFVSTGRADLSPDSTRLLETTEAWAVVWDLAAGKKILTLNHPGNWVTTAKYSPQGDRIATATRESVRVWDSNDGRLLVDIQQSNPGLQHWSPLVQQPPLCRIRQ